MAEYIVKHTTIKHMVKDDKVTKVYEPGDVIELSSDKARRLGDNVVKADKAARPARRGE